MSLLTKKPTTTQQTPQQRKEDHPLCKQTHSNRGPRRSAFAESDLPCPIHSQSQVESSHYMSSPHGCPLTEHTEDLSFSLRTPKGGLLERSDCGGLESRWPMGSHKKSNRCGSPQSQPPTLAEPSLSVAAPRRCGSSQPHISGHGP